MDSEIKNLGELEEIVRKEKENHKKIVFTNGCYDILHKGHIYLLRTAAELGDILIVAINSDKSVRNFKGKNRPKNNEIDRAYVLAAIKGVDYVIIFYEDAPLNLLERLKPDINVKGGSALPERVREEKLIMDSYGGKIVSFPLIRGYSTTKVIDRIKNGS